MQKYNVEFLLALSGGKGSALNRETVTEVIEAETDSDASSKSEEIAHRRTKVVRGNKVIRWSVISVNSC